jgi:hypothetical protein
VNDELQRFVREALARGLAREAIRSLAYELCAEFLAADAGGGPTPLGSECWKHVPGRKCFRFEAIVRVP